MDDGSVPGLCQLGLHAACPRVQKLTLSCGREAEAQLIKTTCSSFSELTELLVKRYPGGLQPGVPSFGDAEPFCGAMISSCPKLAKLSMNDINLGNDGATKIIRGMSAHNSLESIM